MGKQRMKIKRIVFVMGCIVCVLISSVSMAATITGRWVGSHSGSESSDICALTLTTTAKHQYGLFNDKMSGDTTLSGRDAYAVVSPGVDNQAFTGMQLIPNKTQKAKLNLRVYYSKLSNSGSKSIDTDNTSITAYFIFDGAYEKAWTIVGK